MSKLLISESPLQVLPSLAVKIGLNEAIFLQQLHYWLNASKHEADGKRWIFNTYQEWVDQFPFFSERTIKRIVERLKELSLIETTKQLNRDKFNHTLWYTIDYEQLENVTNNSDNLAHSESDNLAHSESDNLTQTIYNNRLQQETTTLESPPTPPGGGGENHGDEFLDDDNESYLVNLERSVKNNWILIANQIKTPNGLPIKFTEAEWQRIFEYALSKKSLPHHVIRANLISLHEWAVEGKDICESLLRSIGCKVLIKPYLIECRDKQGNRIYNVEQLNEMRNQALVDNPEV